MEEVCLEVYGDSEALFLPAQVGGTRLSVLVDSGASKSVMDRGTARHLLNTHPQRCKLHRIATHKFRVASGEQIRCNSLLEVDICFGKSQRCKSVLGSRKVSYPFFVLDLGGNGQAQGGNSRDAILGREGMGYLGLSDFKFGKPGEPPSFPGGVAPPRIPCRRNSAGMWVCELAPLEDEPSDPEAIYEVKESPKRKKKKWDKLRNTIVQAWRTIQGKGKDAHFLNQEPVGSYKLQPQLFRRCLERARFRATVDGMATHSTAQLPQWVGPVLPSQEEVDEGRAPWKVDLFCQSARTLGRDQRVWLNPPWYLLPHVVDWIQENPDVSVLLFCPSVPSTTWWKRAKRLSSKVLHVRRREGMFISRNRKPLPTPGEYDYCLFLFSGKEDEVINQVTDVEVEFGMEKVPLDLDEFLHALRQPKVEAVVATEMPKDWSPSDLPVRKCAGGCFSVKRENPVGKAKPPRSSWLPFNLFSRPEELAEVCDSCGSASCPGAVEDELDVSGSSRTPLPVEYVFSLESRVDTDGSSVTGKDSSATSSLPGAELPSVSARDSTESTSSSGMGVLEGSETSDSPSTPYTTDKGQAVPQPFTEQKVNVSSSFWKNEEDLACGGSGDKRGCTGSSASTCHRVASVTPSGLSRGKRGCAGSSTPTCHRAASVAPGGSSTESPVLTQESEKLGENLYTQNGEQNSLFKPDKLDQEEAPREEEGLPNQDSKDAGESARSGESISLITEDAGAVGTVEERAKLEALLCKYALQFEPATWKEGKEMGAGVKHPINLIPGAKPFRAKPYRMSPLEQQALADILEKYLSRGWIQPCESEWGAPVFMVPKKTIDPKTGRPEYRMVVDYRRVNAVSTPCAYPLPQADTILRRWSGKKFFSCLDFESGYHQIPLADDAKKVSAFVCEKGLFAFNVTPFGLHSAPATFQAMVDRVFAGPIAEGWCAAYIDDVTIASSSWEEHLHHIETILQILKKNNLTLRRKKCFFGMDRCNLLGHVISSAGVMPEKQKVQAMLDFPRPSSIKGVQCFLGMVNYYSEYVHRFATIRDPLVNLQRVGNTQYRCKDKKIRCFLDKKEVPEGAVRVKDPKVFLPGEPNPTNGPVWDDKVEASFQQVKEAMAKATLLNYPNPEEEYTIHTDASSVAIGGILSQSGRPVAYYSRKLRGAELNYGIYDTEGLALVECVRKWMHMIDNGRRVECHVDNSALSKLLNQQFTCPRQWRWCQILGRLPIDLKWVKGEVNPADAFTRQDLHMLWDLDVSEVDTEGPCVPPLKLVDPDANKTWEDAYLKDPALCVVWNVLNKRTQSPNAKRISEEYHLSGGLVFRSSDDRLAVPQNMRKELLEAGHQLAGHGGSAKVLWALRMYTWHGMRGDILQYCRRCPTCQMNKRGSVPYQARPHAWCPPSAPFERLHVDFVGDFEDITVGTKKGKPVLYNYVMTAICPFSKFAFAVPCRKNVTSEETIRMLQTSVFATTGIPKVLVTDRGSVFESEVFTSRMADMGVEHRLCSAKYPQANGVVERLHRDINSMLKCSLNTWKNTTASQQWLDCLGPAVMAHNQTLHSVLGCSPYEVLFGCAGRGAVSTWQDRYGLSPVMKDAAARAAMLKKFNAQVKANLEREHQRMSRQLWDEKNPQPCQIRPGDHVYVKNDMKPHPPFARLQPKWLGPFAVVSVTADTVLLDVDRDCCWNNQVHLSRVKLYHRPGKGDDRYTLTQNNNKEGPNSLTPATATDRIVGDVGGFAAFDVKVGKHRLTDDWKIVGCRKVFQGVKQRRLRHIFLAKEWKKRDDGNPPVEGPVIEVPFSCLVSDDNNRLVHVKLRDYLLANRKNIPTRQALGAFKVSWFGLWLDSHRVDSHGDPPEDGGP